MLRGTALMELERYKDAASDFSKVIFLNPTMSSAFLERGKARIKLGRDDDACDDFSRAAELNRQTQTTAERSRADCDAKFAIRELSQVKRNSGC